MIKGENKMSLSPPPMPADEGAKEEKKSPYHPFDEWEIKNAADTLNQAEEIKSNPEKMKHVKTHMEKNIKHSQKAIGNLDELRAVARKKRSSLAE